MSLNKSPPPPAPPCSGCVLVAVAFGAPLDLRVVHAMFSCAEFPRRFEEVLAMGLRHVGIRAARFPRGAAEGSAAKVTGKCATS